MILLLYPTASSAHIVGFSEESVSFNFFLAGGDCIEAWDVGATNMFPIVVRTSFGDVAKTTLGEFWRVGGVSGEPLALATPAALARGGVPLILTILVTPTC